MKTKSLTPVYVEHEIGITNKSTVAYQKALRYLMNAVILKSKSDCYLKLFENNFQVEPEIWDSIDEPKEYFLTGGK